MSDLASWAAPIGGLILGLGGIFAGRRKTKAETANMITDAAGKLVTQLTAQIERADARAQRAEAIAEEAHTRAEAAEARAEAAERRVRELTVALARADQVNAEQAEELASLRKLVASNTARVDELRMEHATGEVPITPPANGGASPTG